MKNCEYCKGSNTGEYGSGRFCCEKCARQFVSRQNREEKNRKISNTLKKRGREPNNFQSREQLLEFAKIGREALIKKWKLFNESCPWEKKSNRVKRKIILEEQIGCCAICRIKEWNNKLLKLRLDHIDGDRYNESRKNLRFICPNCDSQLDTYCSNNTRKTTVSSEQIRESLIRNNMSIQGVVKDIKISSANWYRINKIRNNLVKEEFLKSGLEETQNQSRLSQVLK